MNKCVKCNKIIIKDKVCKKCANLIGSNFDLYINKTIKWYLDNIETERSATECANWMWCLLSSLEQNYKDLELIPNKLYDIKPATYEEAKQIYIIKFRKEFFRIKQEFIDRLSRTGEVKYFTAIVGLLDEFNDIKDKFPELTDAIYTKDLEEIIEKGI